MLTAMYDKFSKILCLWITPNKYGLIYNVRNEDKALEHIESTGVKQELTLGDFYRDMKLHSVGGV